MSTPGLAEEAQALLDDAVRHAPRVGERRQPRLDDLALAGALRLAVRDAHDGVDLRVVRQDELLAFLGLEAADDPLAGAVEHLDDRAGGLPGVAAARPGHALLSRASTVSPSIAPCMPERGTNRSSPSGTRTNPKPSGRTVIRPATRFENSMAEYFSPRIRAISPLRSSASRRSRKASSSASPTWRAFASSRNERTREPFWRRRSRISESRGITRRSLSPAAGSSAAAKLYQTDIPPGDPHPGPLPSPGEGEEVTGEGKSRDLR